MRRALIVLGMIVGLAACGGNDGGTEPTTTPPEETAPVTSPSEATTTTPVDGTWAIDEVTKAEAFAAIQEHGFGRDDLRVFMGDLGATEWFGLTLQLQGGSYALFGSPDGADPGGVDTGSTYTVEDDILTFVYGAGGTSTLRWSIEGERLSLELLEDTQADYLGLPTDLWVAGLYTSEPFVRVDP